jgi:hypothetical protein
MISEPFASRTRVEKESTTAPRVRRLRFNVSPIDSVSLRAASSVADRTITFEPPWANAVCIASVSARTVLPVRRAAAIVVMNRPDRAAPSW